MDSSGVKFCDEEKSLGVLHEAFGSCCSLEEIASAYRRSKGDVMAAGDILCGVQDLHGSANGQKEMKHQDSADEQNINIGTSEQETKTCEIPTGTHVKLTKSKKATASLDIQKSTEELLDISARSLGRSKAIDDNNSVYTWERGGTLGHGDDTDRTNPELLTNLENQIAVQDCARKRESFVFGDNKRGQLGHEGGNEIGFGPWEETHIPLFVTAPVANGEIGGDRISQLPDEIKVRILSSLETKCAVSTSALARSWRHLWTRLPCLRLDRSLDRTNETVTSNWIERAYHLISSLEGPLLDFEVHHCFHSFQSALLQSLLNLVLQRGGTETFDLSNYSTLVELHLPNFHALRILRLSGCYVVLPTGFLGFKHLTSLQLELVKISSEDLHLLIHTSKHLSTFCGKNFLGKDSLSVNLNSPCLRQLEFSLSESFEKLLVLSAPLLEEVHISVSTQVALSEKMAWVALHLLASASTVRSLSLSCGVVETLAVVDLPSNFIFPRLRCLKLSLNVTTMDSGHFDGFIWLLRCMPSLQELEVKLLGYSSWGSYISELFEKKQHNICNLLKKVSIIASTSDVVCSLNVIRFFLLNGNVLEKLVIEDEYGGFHPDVIEELQELLSTVSSNVQVVFLM